jgi:hypothetical protein
MSADEHDLTHPAQLKARMPALNARRGVEI